MHELPGINFVTRRCSLYRTEISIVLVCCLATAIASAQTGTVAAWAWNPFGQISVPGGLNDVVSIAAGGNHSMALRSNGSVVCWGDDGFGQSTLPSSLGNVVAIAAGADHSVAVIHDGTVVEWGWTAVMPVGVGGIVEVSAGEVFTVALRNDGNVLGWGRVTPPPGLSNVVSVAAGFTYAMALKDDGTVVAWYDHGIPFATPYGLTNVVAIAAGNGPNLAVKSDGNVIAWGTDYFGATVVPADLTNAVGVAAGWGHSVALKRDGKVVVWGNNGENEQAVPPGLSGVVSVSAGYFHSLALVRGGSPYIVRQPRSRTAYSGSDVFLSAWGIGSPSLRYQWQLNGVDLPGATNALLHLPGVQLINVGNYRVVCSNALASVISSNAALAVNLSPPLIVAQPTNQLVAAGSNTTVTANVLGSLPLTYQWRFSGTNIAGATNAALLLTNLQLATEGNYGLAVSNAYGWSISSNAYVNVVDYGEALNSSNLTWLTLGDAAWFVQTNMTHDGYAAARSGFISNNQQSVLQTTVNGPGTLTFWWNVSCEPIGDYLDFSVNGLVLAQTSGNPGWQQQTAYVGDGVQALQWTFSKNSSVNDGLDSAWLDQVSFVPGGTAPFITLNPTNQVVFAGSNATLRAAASGSPPLHLQWKFGLTNLPGATNLELVLATAQLANEGSYSLVVSNSFGVTNSAVVLVNVVDVSEALNATNLTWFSSGDKPWYPQTTTTHDGVAALQSGAVTGSQQSSLATSVNGPGRLTYWWKASSETNNDYVKFSVDGVEQVRISGNVDWQQQTNYLTAGPHTLAWSYLKNATINNGSDAAWLDQVSYVEGVTPAYVLSNPADQIVALFSNATFSVLAQGTPPLVFQWRFNNTDIPGATSSVLGVANAQIANVGSYSVVVTNQFGQATSAGANLELLSVSAWGAGQSNPVVSPNFGQSRVPTNSVRASAIAAGGFHSLALKPDGRVVAWGWNGHLQTNVPVTLTNAVSVVAGLNHSLALRNNGTVSAWGNSSFGQTFPLSQATNVSAISAGWHHNLALRSNGTVVAWGAGTSSSVSPHFGQSAVPASLTNVVAVAGGGYHSLALKTDGTVTAWGWNASGQTNVPTFLDNVVAIAAGGSNSLALKRDGSLVAWGSNAFGQTNVPAGLSNVVAITAGAAHCAAVKQDGMLVVWGLNANNQTNVPAFLTNIMSVAAGGFHNLSLVNLGPVGLLNQPASLTIFEGSPASFNVAALGSPPLAYQWQFNDDNIPGATNGALNFSDAQLTNSGNYRLVVSNSYGVVTSSVAVLTVNDTAPFFVVQPTNQYTVLNSNTFFAVNVGGLPPLSYQWMFNGTNLVGRTNPTLSVVTAQSTNEGVYSVVASNAFGVTPSANAILNVMDLPEALDATNLAWTTSNNPTWFPQMNSKHDGIAAAGVGPLALGQLATLQTTVIGPSTFSFWWMTSNLQFNAALTFSINGVNQGSISPSSGWQQRVFYLAAGTNVLRWTLNASSSGSYYGYVDQVVNLPGGSAPLFTTFPLNQTVGAGSNVTFSVLTGGTPPLAYQWRFAGTNIAGETGASLALNNVQPPLAGEYTVVVTNAYGSTNASASLTVNPSVPVVWTQPVNQEMVRGGTVTFSVLARGSDPLSYQWQLNDDNLPGATNSSLTLGTVQTNQAGTYRVVITNLFGTATSAEATLTIVRTVIVGWGSVFTSSPNPPLGLTNVTGVSGGDNFSVVLKADGTVTAWGWDAFDRLDVPVGLSNVVAVAAGGFHSAALLNDGTVTAWGHSSSDSSVNVPVGLSNVVKTVAGYRFNLGLKRDGLVTAWGESFLNPLSVPVSLSNVVDVSAGQYHSLALKRNGTLTAWGGNSAGPTNIPPGVSNVIAVAAGHLHSMVLQRDGTVAVWSGFSQPATIPAGLDNVLAIAAGRQHCLALRGNGTVVAWGINSSGQTNVPAWLTNVVAISGGSSHSLALLNDGSPYVARQPWTQTAFTGETVTFEVVALGLSPLTYQWQINGSNILGATQPTLVLTNVPLTAAGNYLCVVGNAVDTATSLPAWLTVVRSVPQFVPGASGMNNGAFNLNLSGLSGHGQIILSASTNLTHWQPILTNPPVIGSLILTDFAATNWPHRFYRIQEQ